MWGAGLFPPGVAARLAHLCDAVLEVKALRDDASLARLAADPARRAGGPADAPSLGQRSYPQATLQPHYSRQECGSGHASPASLLTSPGEQEALHACRCSLPRTARTPSSNVTAPPLQAGMRPRSCIAWS